MNSTGPSSEAVPFELVKLANGTFSIHSTGEDETFHPVIGPMAEADALYIDQLRLRARLSERQSEFVIWDVGLGGGGNACTALHRLKEVPGTLRLISFDSTLAPLHFAREHADKLVFPAGLEEAIDCLLVNNRCSFRHGELNVHWEIRLGDFPTLLASKDHASGAIPAPDAIFFDAYSPARNPAMWTVQLFESIFRRLDPQRPCALATYSRSTIPRVTLLLAGFFVGAGSAVAAKEETTIAANTLSLIERPLGARWLERARTSHSAEPLRTSDYRIAPLSPETWERLRTHPQFE